MKDTGPQAKIAPCGDAVQGSTAAPSAASATELLVCVKCRRGRDMPDDARRPGEHLFDAISAIGAPDGVRVTAVECLQNCDYGCTVALRGGDAKWTYVFANVDEATQAQMIVDGAAQYHASADGVIPWRQRPEHFKRNCAARLPPVTPSETQSSKDATAQTKAPLVTPSQTQAEDA